MPLLLAVCQPLSTNAVFFVFFSSSVIKCEAVAWLLFYVFHVRWYFFIHKLWRCCSTKLSNPSLWILWYDNSCGYKRSVNQFCTLPVSWIVSELHDMTLLHWNIIMLVDIDKKKHAWYSFVHEFATVRCGWFSLPTVKYQFSALDQFRQCSMNLLATPTWWNACGLFAWFSFCAVFCR